LPSISNPILACTADKTSWASYYKIFSTEQIQINAHLFSAVLNKAKTSRYISELITNYFNTDWSSCMNIVQGCFNLIPTIVNKMEGKLVLTLCSVDWPSRFLMIIPGG